MRDKKETLASIHIQTYLGGGGGEKGRHLPTIVQNAAKYKHHYSYILALDVTVKFSFSVCSLKILTARVTARSGLAGSCHARDSLRRLAL